MELLLVLIGEFFFVVVFPAIALLLELLFPLFGLILEVVSKFLGIPSLLRPRRAAPAGKTPSPWPRRIGKLLLGLTAATTVLVILLNTVLFEPTLRRGLSRARERTGV